MAGNDWKERVGVVYSTNSNFQYDTGEQEEVETLPPGKQKLYVSLDRRNRGGKQVTIVEGFVGKNEDLAALGRTLKTKCGVGGSAKDGEMIVQGDFREKVSAILTSMGYAVKKRGGN